MRVLRLTVMAGLAALFVGAPAEAQQPIKQRDTLTGTLRLVRTPSSQRNENRSVSGRQRSPGDAGQ